MTHDETVQKANLIFAAITDRQHLPNIQLTRGAGDYDCFVLADQFLGAIARQWQWRQLDLFD